MSYVDIAVWNGPEYNDTKKYDIIDVKPLIRSSGMTYPNFLIFRVQNKIYSEISHLISRPVHASGYLTRGYKFNFDTHVSEQDLENMEYNDTWVTVNVDYSDIEAK